MQICNRLCKSSAICSPLANLTVGASGVTTYPASSLTSCGPTWSGSSLGSLASQAPSATMHCESFYMTTSISNAKVTDVCGGTPCNVRLTLSSGTTASTTVSGNTLYLGGFPQTPTPYGPTPYGPTPYGPTPHGRRLSAYQNQSSVPGRRF